MTKLSQGLRPTPKDDRDYKLGALFQLPELSKLPENFVLEGFNIKNQQDSDFCSGFAVTGLSELQEGVELSPEYQFALSKIISGDIEEWGQDARTAMKTAVKLGSLEKSQAPYSLENKDTSFLRDPKNWPGDLMEKAKKHQKSVYIRVSGKYDAFDDIRASIYKWRDERRGVALGINFSWPSNQIILDDVGPGFGHMVYVAGWKTVNGVPYLVMVNSWGKEAGEQGTHLLSRNVVNYYDDMYGAYMFVDKPREEIQYMVDNGIKEGDNFLIQLWKALSSLILSPFLTVTEKTEIVKNTTDAVKKIEESIKPKTESRIVEWAKAIETYEGYFEGSRSWRNKNPGNLRFVGQPKAIGKDDKNFCIFATYQDGFNALTQMLTNACTGKSKTYKPDMSLLDFFSLYAPSTDKNNPSAYAFWVADKLNVKPDDPIKNLA